MKKTLIALMLVLLSAMLIVSCSNSSKKVYTITFNSNGGSDIADVEVKEGEKVPKPTTDPTMIGYEFVNWTTDEDGEKAYDFETPVTSNITLYAQWKDHYDLGDLGPAGGWIFYDCDADNESGNSDNLKSETCGWRYLEAAPTNLSTDYCFGLAGTSVGTNTAIGSGKSNTDLLKTKNAEVATACAAYSTTVDGTAYDDWFIPSKEELNMLYKNLANKIGNISSFLTSSENSTNNAWRLDSKNGLMESKDRSYNYKVRPIRSFM